MRDDLQGICWLGTQKRTTIMDVEGATTTTTTRTITKANEIVSSRLLLMISRQIIHVSAPLTTAGIVLTRKGLLPMVARVSVFEI